MSKTKAFVAKLRGFSSGPFRYFVPSVRTESFVLFVLLLVQIAFLCFARSFKAVNLIFWCAAASVCADLLDSERNLKDAFFWISAMIRGMLAGFFLPETYPVFAAFTVVFCAMFLNRAIFGGFSNSWVNPVASSVAVCYILFFFEGHEIPPETLSLRNPSLKLISDGTVKILKFDTLITSFLNEKLFSRLGVAVPSGYMSILWDTGSAIPSARFNFLTLFSSIVLFSFKIRGMFIPILSAVVYGVLVRFILPFILHSPLFQGDIILALFSSSYFFGTLYLIQWYGTIPLTNRGKTLYAILAGILEFFLLEAGMRDISFVFVVLILNVVSPLIQTLENHYELRRIKTL